MVKRSIFTTLAIGEEGDPYPFEPPKLGGFERKPKPYEPPP